MTPNLPIVGVLEPKSLPNVQNSAASGLNTTNVLSTNVQLINTNGSGRHTVIPTVTIPTAAARILTTNGTQYDIFTILSFSFANVIGLAIPKGQLIFVVPEDQPEPNIDAFDTLMIFAQHNNTDVLSATGTVATALLNTTVQNDADNRLGTFLIDRVHKIRDVNRGKIYMIEFSTFMKKFDVTSVFRPDNGISGGLPSLWAQQIQISDVGDIVYIACTQANVAAAYIFIGVGGTESLYKQTTSTILAQDVVIDNAAIRTFNPNFPLKTTIPVQVNLADYHYQHWSNIIGALVDASFCEAFFSRFGDFYFRQFGGFRSAGQYDILVDPRIILNYDVSKGDDDPRPITDLTLSFYGYQNPTAYTPPDRSTLVAQYGIRLEQIDVPWAIFSWSQNNSPEPITTVDPSGSMNDFLQDFATWYAAMHNTNLIHAKVQLIGNNIFEVGQTIYIPVDETTTPDENGLVFYVTGIQQTFAVGGQWVTDLTLEFGRTLSTDLLGYISKQDYIIGTSQVDQANAHGNPTVVTVEPINPGTITGHNPFKSNTSYKITNQYGYGAQDPNPGVDYHTGVDLVPDDGSTDLVALATSDVISIGTSQWDDGWGYYICYQPLGTQYVICYAHLASVPLFGPGQAKAIQQGQVIGQMGATGRVTGTHLHFQVDAASAHAHGGEPAYLFGQTITPAVVLDPTDVSNHMSFQVGGDSIAIQTPPTVTGAWKPITLSDGSSGFSDPNYSTDVVAWATQIVNSGVGKGRAAVAFWTAVSIVEVSDSTVWNNPTTQFHAMYNFANVMNQIGSGYDNYTGIAQAASVFTSYINESRYEALRSYMNDPKTGALGPFDPIDAFHFLTSAGFQGASQQTPDNKFSQAYYMALNNIPLP